MTVNFKVSLISCCGVEMDKIEPFKALWQSNCATDVYTFKLGLFLFETGYYFTV